MNANLQELTDGEKIRILDEYFENGADAEGFISQIFSDGISKVVDEEEVQNWLRNPEDNLLNMENYSMYQYMSNPGVFQSYDLTQVLPNLNYKITTLKKDEKYEDNYFNLKRSCKQIDHKQLTRDLLGQLIGSGTLCAIWVGSKKNPYLYVFNDLNFVFPAYIKNGKWVVWVDLDWMKDMGEVQRQNVFENLSPYINEELYDLYKNGDVKYVELPQDKSVCLRTHTLFRNQRFGLPWNTQTIFDNLHKEKLKILEKSISNKVINSIVVLKYGESDSTDYHYSKVMKKIPKVYSGVKKAMQKATADGTTIIGTPHWVGLDFPDIKTDGLDPKKFNSINDDLNAGYNGLMSVVGGKGTFSGGQLSLDIMYKKIGVLLESIETEVYQKLLNYLLNNKYKNIYSLEYDKQTPLSTKDKVNVLQTLNSSFGFSLKDVIDHVDGVDFNEYIEQSIYEQEELKLPKRIQPYSSSYTSSSSKGGAPESDITTESGEGTATGDGNELPSPSD